MVHLLIETFIDACKNKEKIRIILKETEDYRWVLGNFYNTTEKCWYVALSEYSRKGKDYKISMSSTYTFCPLFLKSIYDYIEYITMGGETITQKDFDNIIYENEYVIRYERKRERIWKELDEKLSPFETAESF